MSAAAATHRRPASHTTLRGHVRRAAGRDHNPLCRPVDRAYSRLVASAVLTALASIVLAAVAALLVHHVETADARDAARDRHVVTAVTTGPAQSVDPRAGRVREQAPARWTYPVGPEAGQVSVPAGTPAGTAVAVGLNGAGQPVDAPRSSELIVADAVLAGLGTVLVLALGADGWFALRRRRLDRRAERDWESAWEQVEPRWSGRR
ncbi:Rv1733c family protein [Kitasatospora sp. NPDC001095]